MLKVVIQTIKLKSFSNDVFLFDCFVGLVVTVVIAVHEVSVKIPGSDKVLCCEFFYSGRVGFSITVRSLPESDGKLDLSESAHARKH